MSFTDACCNVPPFDSNYVPKGTMETVGDIPVYVIGPKDAKHAIVVAYDIFGLHTNTKQYCDILANISNWKVVMPDFLRKEPFQVEKLSDREFLMAWVGRVGTFQAVSPDIDLVLKWLQDGGAVSAGIIGFCWGAKIAIQAITKYDFLNGASLIHPSMLTEEDFEAATSPILLLPTKDEDEKDMEKFYGVLSKKPFADKCSYHRFGDMHHGFAAARGNWDNEENNKQAVKTIKLSVAFFKSVL